MDTELLERLLHEEESATLDFKKEQYLFSKATDDEKSELLKDILGFCNAWRRADAYILIGVEEIRGGRSHVTGILSEHLADHALQQFVNNLTNQPVRFHYEAVGFEGKQVGVIRIEEQSRPVYLKKDYGKLKRETVYVRRGSSTDPTKPASLEEIARMGMGYKEPNCDLQVEFAVIGRDVSLGTHLSLDAEYCQLPPVRDIPDLTEKRQPGGIFGGLTHTDSLYRIDSMYYRRLADYELNRRLMKPVRLLLSNVGQVAACNVQIDISVPKASKAIVLNRSKFPTKPSRRIDPFFIHNVPPVVSTLSREPGGVTISDNTERYLVEIDCGDLQPGRQVWSELFYFVTGETGCYTLQGKIYADKLPRPKDFCLTVDVTVSTTVISVDELCAL